VPAALASECASDQGKFWEFADVMFEKQSELNASGTLPASFYTAVAKDLGLNTSKFDTCVADKKFQSIIDADQAGGNTAGVSGTPATFLNGTMVTSSSGNSVGAAPQATFDAIIDGLLK
jgi:protein-disulfide isomerase